MSDRGINSSIYIDWFNVSYRTVVSAALAGVLLILGGGGFWYWRNVYKPRADAEASITDAGALYRQASKLKAHPEVGDQVKRADKALIEARTGFDDRRYADARFAALYSSDLSRNALRAVEGTEETNPDKAYFYKLEGDVRVKRAGSFSWEPARPDLQLTVGDQVKTSSKASAQVIYFDGTITTVERGSLLEIRELFEDPVTRVRRVRERVRRGEATASIQRKNTDGSYHEVSTDKVAARAEEEAEFRVAVDSKRGTAKVDAFTGKVTVAAGGRQTRLEGGERIRASADGTLGQRETLPTVPRLRSPADQRVFVFGDQAEAKVSVSWEQLQGIETYHLMIATQQLFTEPLFEGERKAGSASLQGLAEGDYFWKVAAVRDGVRGRYSNPRVFRISTQRIQDDSDRVPPDLQVDEFVEIGTMVVISGRTEPGATLWIDNEKVDVYEDGSFHAVIRLQRDGLNEVRFIAQDTAGNETTAVKQGVATAY